MGVTEQARKTREETAQQAIESPLSAPRERMIPKIERTIEPTKSKPAAPSKGKAIWEGRSGVKPMATKVTAKRRQAAAPKNHPY